MKSNFLKILVLGLFLGAFACGSAQERDFIRGSLIDAETKEPIVFANIRVKDRALGVISNVDGGFRIPLKYRTYGDILEISSLGYKTKEVAMQTLNKDSVYVLNLYPSVAVLQEAIVTAEYKRRRRRSAKQIVREAIESIPKNYPNHPFSTIGYYRDYQIEKEEYINLNEAILEVFDAGFDQIDTSTTKVQIYAYEQNNQFRRDTVADNLYDYNTGRKTITNAFLSDYGGNEFTILKTHDAIRNYRLNTYDFVNEVNNGDILRNHSFKRLSNTNSADEILYVVKFQKIDERHLALGKIFISTFDFAIHKLEYAVYLRQSNKIVKKTKAENSNKLIFEINTSYKRGVNDKMYLNYISFHNTFKLRIRPPFNVIHIGVDLDKKRFELTFNEEIDLGNDVDMKNFRGYFKGRRIKFKRSLILEKKVFLYPGLISTKERLMWEDLISAVKRNIPLNQKLIYFKVNNINDIHGNVINKSYTKDYNQFREFFVQEVKPFIMPRNNGRYMNGMQPIYTESQPIIKPDNFNDYWMNTPLQKFKD